MNETDLQLTDGRTLHVYDSGTGDLPVFWNHGTPNLGAPPAPLLAESERLGIRWVSFDRPGYGGSSPAPGRTMASVAHDAAAVADELGIDRFAVTGYSGGGSYALGCAATLGDRVSAVATLAAIAPYGVPGLDWFDGMVPSGVASLRAALAGRAAKAAHEASGVEYDPEFAQDDYELFEGEWGWLGSVASHAMDAGPYGLIDDDVSYVIPWGCDPTTIKAPDPAPARRPGRHHPRHPRRLAGRPLPDRRAPPHPGRQPLHDHAPGRVDPPLARRPRR